MEYCSNLLLSQMISNFIMGSETSSRFHLNLVSLTCGDVDASYKIIIRKSDVQVTVCIYLGHTFAYRSLSACLSLCVGSLCA